MSIDNKLILTMLSTNLSGLSEYYMNIIRSYKRWEIEIDGVIFFLFLVLLFSCRCVLVDSDIRWRWDLLGRGEGICVCSGLFWEVQEAKRGCIKQLPSVSFLKGRFQIATAASISKRNKKHSSKASISASFNFWTSFSLP